MPPQNTLCEGFGCSGADISYDLEHPRDSNSIPLYVSENKDVCTRKLFSVPIKNPSAPSFRLLAIQLGESVIKFEI